jgi:hypothetical protein
MRLNASDDLPFATTAGSAGSLNCLRIEPRWPRTAETGWGGIPNAREAFPDA